MNEKFSFLNIGKCPICGSSGYNGFYCPVCQYPNSKINNQ
jgi:hypothetical protein